MTKADIVEKVFTANDFTKTEATEIVESVFDLVKSTLEDGGNIKLPGFGNFELKEKAARRGRNPQTRETIEIEARRILTFKPNQVLKRTRNGGR